MRVPALQTIVVKPELIRIVRRENSRKWQVHYKIEGVKTWFRKSVQTVRRQRGQSSVKYGSFSINFV